MQHQAEVHAHHPAGRGEGVDLLAVDEGDPLQVFLELRVLHQVVQLAGHVVLEDGVAHRGQAGVDLLHEIAPDLALHSRRDEAGRRISQYRQIAAHVGPRCGAREARAQKKAKQNAHLRRCC